MFCLQRNQLCLCKTLISHLEKDVPHVEPNPSQKTERVNRQRNRSQQLLK